MERGSILRFSEEGINHIGAGNEGREARLRTLRFEFQCITRNDRNCLTVKRLGTKTYEQYHRSFLEVA